MSKKAASTQDVAIRRGRNSRRKGQAFEREVAALLREAMPGHFIGRSSQSAGAHTSDVDCPHFWVECKHGKKPNIRAALEQATNDAGKMNSAKLPLAIVKDDREPAFIVMHAKDFLTIVAEWWATRGQG